MSWWWWWWWGGEGGGVITCGGRLSVGGVGLELGGEGTYCLNTLERHVVDYPGQSLHRNLDWLFFVEFDAYGVEERRKEEE